jgi:hypothetical protein
MTTTPDVPDTFSNEQLTEMLDTAPSEAKVEKRICEIRREANPDEPYNGMSRQQLIEWTDEVIEKFLEEQPHVIAAKAVACKLIRKIADQQAEMADMYASEGKECADAWYRDYGQMIACLNLLSGTDLHPDDFIAVAYSHKLLDRFN